jgi:hypothetical protein
VPLTYGIPFNKRTVLVTTMRDPVFRTLHGIALNGKSNYHSIDGYELNSAKLDINDPSYEAGNIWEYHLRWLGSGLDDEALHLAKQRLTLFHVVLVVDGWFDAATQMLCEVWIAMVLQLVLENLYYSPSVLCLCHCLLLCLL